MTLGEKLKQFGIIETDEAIKVLEASDDLSYFKALEGIEDDHRRLLYKAFEPDTQDYFNHKLKLENFYKNGWKKAPWRK